MSLLHAAAWCDDNGVTQATYLREDPTDPWQLGDVIADIELTPGKTAQLKSRLWLAILDHRRAFGETIETDGEVWTLEKVQTGPDTRAWRLEHNSCRTLRRAA